MTLDQPLSFGAFAEAWLSEREEEHISGELSLATIRSYRRSVQGILIPAFGDLPLEDVGLEEIRELRVATQDIPARGNQAINLMRRILAEGERLGFRRPGSNPARRIKRHPEMASARPADPSTVLVMYELCDEVIRGGLKVCHPHLAAIFQLIALTGARPAEIRTLQWSNVHLDEGEYGVLRLQRHKTARIIGEKRIVLGPTARDVIEWQQPDAPQDAVWVFPSHANPGHYYRDITRAWRRLALHAGLDVLCMRDLRSGLATNAYDNGIPLEQIQEMLGHKSLATTRRYTRISARKVSKAYEAVERSVFAPKSKATAKTKAELDDCEPTTDAKRGRRG